MKYSWRIIENLHRRLVCLALNANSHYGLSLLLVVVLLPCAHGISQSISNPGINRVGEAAYLDQSKTAVEALQTWYAQNSGLYNTTGWWNSANAITALANYSRVSKSTKYRAIFANTLHAAQISPSGFPGFINRYYDDEGWWALAWIDVYDLTHQPQYLQMADSIFSDMQSGWDTATCGGGLWWSKDRKHKNAIENELFLAVAASLANRDAKLSKRRHDLSWAQKEWAWFQNSGMINSESLVNDGLDTSDPLHCKNNGKNAWTYNQGVILGALIELHKAMPDTEFPNIATAIADSSIRRLTNAQGILQEPNNAHGGGDIPQFKGIFIRNLMLLNSAFPNSRYRAFTLENVRSILSNDSDGLGHFGFWWTGPFDSADAARQSSALDALNAAASIDLQKLYPPKTTRGPIFDGLTISRGIKNHTLNVLYLGDSITYGVHLVKPDVQSPPAICTLSLEEAMPGVKLFMSNQGHSGHTTVDFIPSSRSDFAQAEGAARQMEAAHPGSIIFSIMLGTNDSANSGPNGAPVSPQDYADNLKEIISRLLSDFPESLIILQRPIWYSPNTYNAADYEKEGLERLQSYFPIIDSEISMFATSNPNRVYRGDTLAFGYFSGNYADLTPQRGQRGVFYLHPNPRGAVALGRFWADAIEEILQKHFETIENAGGY